MNSIDFKHSPFLRPNASWHSVFLFATVVLVFATCNRVGSATKDSPLAYHDHPWQELGPAGPTEELNPGGVAIPHNTVNRGNGPGRVNYLKIHPSDSSVIFACSPTGGLFVSCDSALTWRPAGTDRLPVSGVAAVEVHPSEPHTWFIVTGDGDGTFTYSDGVWRTQDAGLTWECINGLAGIDPQKFGNKRLMASHLALMPENANRLIMAGNHGLYITENALDIASKVKWRRVDSGFYYNIAVHPAIPGLVCASGEEVLRSDDSGITWHAVPLPVNKYERQGDFRRINVQFSKADIDSAAVVIAVQNALKPTDKGEATLWRFGLNGGEWRLIRSLRNSGNVITSRARAFALHPISAQEMLVGNIRPLYRTTDGGITFKPIRENQLHDDIHHLVYTLGGSVVYSCTDGGVAISHDSGVTWEKRELGLGVANVFGLACGQTREPLVVFGAYDTGGNLLRSGAWFHVSWGDGFEGIVSPTDSCLMFITRQNGSMLRSEDCGLEFEKTVSTGLTTTTWHTWTAMNPVDNKVIYLAGSHLVRSINMGLTWERVVFAKDLHPKAYTLYRFYTSAAHPDVMYAYVILEHNETCLFFRTRNLRETDPARITWEALPVSPTHTFPSGFAIDPMDASKFWVTYDHWAPRGKIYRFDGQRYHDIGAGLAECAIGSLILESGPSKRLYMGTTCGLFTRSKSERQWTRLGNLPGLQINSLDINYRTNQLFIGTFGRGVWTGPLYAALQTD